MQTKSGDAGTSAASASDDPSVWLASAFARDGLPPCDVVMKGGVTSGIVYPYAICRIAAQYAIEKIGGTSVGAIAASLTAAAEFRRQSTRSGEGYVELAKLPGRLATKGYLEALFAVDPGFEDYLRAALRFTSSNKGKPSPLSVIAGVLGVILGRPLPLAVLAVVIALSCAAATYVVRHVSTGAALGAIDDVIVALVVVVLVGTPLSIAGCALVASWFARLVTNTGKGHFGWASGHRQSVATTQVAALDSPPPLVDWLYAYIQEVAGRTEEDAPLTFGDLYRAGRDTRNESVPEAERRIDLQMVTTSLTLNRPFRLPFDELAFPGPNLGPTVTRPWCAPFYFKMDEFAAFFPAPVIAYLARCGLAQLTIGATTYHRFPDADRLPIIVASRMSMSFPVLFKAMRLYAKSPEHPHHMVPVWFSDGGLTSNLPVHFFDKPLPTHPTFAIDLLSSNPIARSYDRAKTPNGVHYMPGDVLIESSISPDLVEPWDKLGTSLFEFVGAIIETTRTWQDRVLGRMPGYADRTLGIRLFGNEGGLNLAMPPQMVQELTSRGDRGGTLLMQHYPGNPAPGISSDWPGHRWTRVRIALHAIRTYLAGFTTGYTAQTSGDPPYARYLANQTARVNGSPADPWPNANVGQAVNDAIAGSGAIPGLIAAAAHIPPHVDRGVPTPETVAVHRSRF